NRNCTRNRCVVHCLHQQRWQVQDHPGTGGDAMSLTASPTTNPAVRSLNGEEVPAAGSYALDVSHSQVGFAVRHLMVSKTRGRFSDFAGVIEIAENPLESSVHVTLGTSRVP